MLEHLIVCPERGLCNRLRAIASAKRIGSMTGARCTVVWDWGDYRALFDDDSEWISPAQLAAWERDQRLAGYLRIRHPGAAEGGNRENRRIPIGSHPGVVVTSRFFFNAFEEPLLDTRAGERLVLPWVPRPGSLIWEKVEAFHRAEFGPRTAGLHIRRTDHERSRPHAPDEAYRRVADHLVNDGYLLFLASDNSDSLEMMQRRYGSKLLYHPKTSALRVRWPRAELQITDAIEDMADLWLLAVCDFVIGSASSSFSRMATLLNGSSKCKLIDERPHRQGVFARLLPAKFRRSVGMISPNQEKIFGLPLGMVSAGLANQLADQANHNDVDQSLQPSWQQLQAEIELVLKTKPVSVMDKPEAPTSRSRHDYVSFARYYWPNASSADGLPYVRKDGESNPTSLNPNSDRPRLERMARDSLGAAYCYRRTRDERYAERAALQLRTWFLDPETCMTPHLEYAQIIPGHKYGRSFGVIDGYRLLSALDAAGMLGSSRAWSPTDQQMLMAWAETYQAWLTASKNGQKERAATNNHGTFYDLQVIHLALFVADHRLAKSIAQEAQHRRIALQIRPDGSQPMELARAESWRYSQYNLRGLFKLAICAEYAGVDLWHYQTPAGAGIKKALDFLLLHLEQPQKGWPSPDTVADPGFGWVLRLAAKIYRDNRYLRVGSAQGVICSPLTYLAGF